MRNWIVRFGQFVLVTAQNRDDAIQQAIDWMEAEQPNDWWLSTVAPAKPEDACVQGPASVSEGPDEAGWQVVNDEFRESIRRSTRCGAWGAEGGEK